MNLMNLFSNHTVAVNEIERVTQAIIAGHLNERVNVTGFGDDTKPFGNSINKMLDAIVQPLNVAADYVEHIAKGSIPTKITDNYNGDFNAIKNNLNICIDAINQQVAITKGIVIGDFSVKVDVRSENDEQSKSLIQVVNVLQSLQTEIDCMSAEHNKGDIDVVIDSKKFQGNFQIMAQGINDMVGSHIGDTKKAMAVFKTFGEGNFDASMEQLPGKKIFINNTIEQVRSNLKAVIVDTNSLIKAASDGQLEARADASKHQGDFGKLMQGINSILDAILLPIAEGNRILTQISNGKIDELIAQTYKGDHESMKQAVNNVATTLQGLQKQLQRLTEASREGLLSERGKPEQVIGAYAEIVGGVNNMLDAILLPIGEGNRILIQISNGKIDELIAQTYKGDHESMKQAINNVATTLQGLQKQLQHLTEASREGLLSERGKPEQFKGVYAEVVGGVNEMLDAILLPISEGNRILSLISDGDLRQKVEIPCKGDHDKMKQAVNGVYTWLSELIVYVTKIANGDMTAEMGKASNNDQIHEWLILLKRNIQALTTDVNLLSIAAVEGDLQKRADATKHQGDYRKIIEGLNNTLDGIILPVNEVVAVLTEVEKGDLTKIVHGHYKGQLEDFKDTVNNTIAKIAEIIGEVNSAAANIASASGEISATAQSMSQATNEQAASVEETSSAVEQMSASINQNTENAKVTDGMATQTSCEAIEGGDAVKTTVRAMKSIAGKIGIIDDIAYQTNLLALNAAIEAARAGEHGKGFAVVAAEVRNLAERSQVAAQEIGELASSSVEMAENAGKLFDTIVPSIKKTADLVQEITAASEEQSTGVGQINTAMSQLNQITQQNASASEELAATAEEMSGQAMQLQEMMEFFTLSSNKSPVSKHPSSKPTAKKAAIDNPSFNESEFVKF